MSTHLHIPLLSLEQRFVAPDGVRLSRGMSVIVIGALSILCWTVLVAIVLALWQMV